MLNIELWRKVIATDEDVSNCTFCGNDFECGTVFASVNTAATIGKICDECLDSLTRRKEVPEAWPTLMDLEAARLRYPEPMFADGAAYNEAAGGDLNKEDEIIQSSFIWSMERDRLES